MSTKTSAFSHRGGFTFTTTAVMVFARVGRHECWHRGRSWDIYLPTVFDSIINVKN
jgi:hypothetical protein